MRFVLVAGVRVNARSAAAKIEAYWARNPAMWEYFERSVGCPKDVIEREDLLSIAATSANLRAQDLEALWQADPIRPAAALGDVQRIVKGITTAPIGDLDEAALRTSAAAVMGALERLKKIPGWGTARSSLLLYRLRPNVAPPWGQHVRWAYPQAKADNWISMFLHDAQRQHEALAAALQATEPPYSHTSLLRAWSILLHGTS